MRIGKSIYLDHQATTPVDSQVFAEMTPYFAKCFGNPHSTDHSLGWESSQAVEAAAATIGNLIGADADEIIFTSGATEANNLALLGLARRAAGGKRGRVLVGAIEHKCVLAASRTLEQQLEYDVQYLPVDEQGLINLSMLEQHLSEEVLLVSIAPVNNEIGTIQDINVISKMVRAVGALLHCDGAQAPCAIDMTDMAEFADLLSLSAHKIYGPKGIGALYIRRDLHPQIEPLIYGGGQQSNLRAGTIPVPLCVGMAAATRLLCSSDAVSERKRLRGRTTEFISLVQSLSWPVLLNGPDAARRHPGNANLRFEGFDAQDILRTLQPYLAASTGSACTSGIPEPSHVLRAIGLCTAQADGSIRFSLGRETTDEDIHYAVELIDHALERISRSSAVVR
ncbi:MAG: cysteine desulfurase [Parvibaculum sp.]|uniref:cysteine desulfurase family protein n=1 Tax=Parvibaculum sp. TaxID=2024848 RepID=UPI0035B7F238